MATNQIDEVKRPLAEFPASVWEARFQPIMVDEQVYEAQAKEVKRLKEEVVGMLVRVKKGTPLEQLVLIDTLERLGISYHFQQHIDMLLDSIFHQNANSDQRNDLFATALMFRLLRQHGFNISSGVFHQFLDANIGGFEESLGRDTKGVLSLYEAAHLRTHGEDLLEKALCFTTAHLKDSSGMSCFLAKQVKHALHQPLHLGVPIIEARHYMSIYGEDEGHSSILLRLANLNYYHIQILYGREFQQLFKWSKSLKTASEFTSLARDRLLESYFLALTICGPPHSSIVRLTVAKSFLFITIIDDLYDAFGLDEELQDFGDALERWDVREIHRLPEYMKGMYTDLINFCEAVEEDLTKQGMSRPHALSQFKNEWKHYARTNYIQFTWLLKGDEVPSFEDYKEIGLVTCSFYASVTASYIFMDSGTEDVFDWLAEYPKILKACSAVGRFLNDIASYETEIQRGATGIGFYMEQYEVSKEETMKKFDEIAVEAWKDINEQLLSQTGIPKEILTVCLNHARVCEITYKDHVDGYTDPHQNIGPHIFALLLDVIAV